MATKAERREERRGELPRLVHSTTAPELTSAHTATGPDARVDAIDFARGIAITLMILSHGVKGLLSFAQIPAWGMVPIHLITKISSSLFILVFGVALAVAYLPKTSLPDWPRYRRQVLIRAVVVFFWYKVLTIVELFSLYSKEEVLNTLLYKSFPVYAEILGFYAIALLWVPFVLPIFARAPLTFRLATPLLVGLAGYALYHGFDFWGSPILRALLVEHESYYTWGQFARGPLVFVGLLFGQFVLWQQIGRAHV